MPKTPIEYDFQNDKPTQDKSNDSIPLKNNINNYEGRRSQAIEDDPFWRNRDATQRILNEKRVSRVEEFNEDRVSSRKRKNKIDASGLPPAGLRSLERLKLNQPTSKIWFLFFISSFSLLVLTNLYFQIYNLTFLVNIY